MNRQREGGISWTNTTWNPVTGCSKVSQGCKNCYAEREWARLSGYSRSVYRGRDFTDVRTHSERLAWPLRLKKPHMIFVNSMSDLFHEKVPEEFILEVFETMAECEQHRFQILTKRPERMVRLMPEIYEQLCYPSSGCPVSEERKPLPNVWLGVSIEDQATADERIPRLLRTPAAVRFLSYEPALGPIDLGRSYPCGYYCDEKIGHVDHPFWSRVNSDIHWVIIGTESGPQRREMKLEWAEKVLEDCRLSGVSVFVKQLPIGGKVSKKPEEWPAHLRVQEFPETKEGLTAATAKPSGKESD